MNDIVFGTLADGVLASVLVVTFTGILAVSSGLLHSKTPIAARVVDAACAAVSVTLSLSLLACVDSMLPFKVFDSKMFGSAVVFMGNPKPPSPASFVCCSACGFMVGLILNLCDSVSTLGPMHTQTVALGLLLFFWKIYGASFSAAVGLAVYLALLQSPTWTAPALRYLACPWFAGHAFLYALALVLAIPRSRLRVQVVQREFSRSLFVHTDPAEQRASLKQLFETMDTSKDGRIDATEFKVAMRSLIGADLPLSDCEAVISSVDTDGNGTIDFDEFCTAVEHAHLDGLASPSKLKSS